MHPWPESAAFNYLLRHTKKRSQHYSHMPCGACLPVKYRLEINNSAWLYFVGIRIQHQEERLSLYSDISLNLTVRCELASSHVQNKRNALSSICLSTMPIKAIWPCKITIFLLNRHVYTLLNKQTSLKLTFVNWNLDYLPRIINRPCNTAT